MKHFQLLNKIGMPLALKSVGVLQIVKMTKIGKQEYMRTD
jgi:hypothetical protein